MSFSMRQWFRTYTTVGALLLVCMVFAFLSPQAFATVDNAINVSRQIAFLVLIAVGATFVMAAGEFDLSVGAMASFAGVMAAQLAVNGTDVVVSVALTLAMCVLMGMFNGWLVGYFGVLSFITTLATGTMLSGLTFWHKVGAFGLCALAAGIAGVLLASRLGSAHPTGGNGLFLPAYAAAFLGTTAVRGGMPNILGSLLGAATLGILANGLTILNVPSFLQDMLTGAIVVAAIVSQKWGDVNSR